MCATVASPPRVDPAIQVRGLVKRYADVIAVNGIDLEIRTGECFGLLGPNGAGKTTTVEILEGILAPSSGELTLLGMSWGRDELRLRQRIGIALQETRLPERLSVTEVLDLFRSFYPRPRSVAALLSDVELTEKADAWVGKLSGGQRQRLAIARALVRQPEIYLFDDSFSALDLATDARLRAALKPVTTQATVVIVAQRVSTIIDADQILVLEDGEVVGRGRHAELLETCETYQEIVRSQLTAEEAA
jgi:ABC-2 type transport system ATP-binding protein